MKAESFKADFTSSNVPIPRETHVATKTQAFDDEVLPGSQDLGLQQ